MATIKPFAALRPKPELAGRICELPYDVMSSEEAREMASDNPLSFLHVSKPEIDLPPETDVYAPEVYAKGKENLDWLIAEGALRQDAEPCFYLYRQIMGGHSQTGLVAVASCEEYLSHIIKKHEFTRPDKEDDRVRHIESLNSQTGPVFLTYRDVPAINEFVEKQTRQPPEIDFTAGDGVRHSAWSLSAPADVAFLQSQFAQIPYLYIADGHHRSAAAARVYQNRHGAGNSSYFLSVIFPQNQMQILAYNRVVKDLNGLSADEFLSKLEKVCDIRLNAPAEPGRKHELAMYLEGKWHGLRFRPELTSVEDPIELLDVTLLQKHILAPILGVEDPRTSKRIHFVGGIRGAGELERLVRQGEYTVAFSMYPTSIAELMAVADVDGIMPPKSTWFEPKLRDAMFCHMI
jgi:uncharacterized protein (DUF1015 family)